MKYGFVRILGVFKGGGWLGAPKILKLKWFRITEEKFRKVQAYLSD